MKTHFFSLIFILGILLANTAFGNDSFFDTNSEQLSESVKIFPNPINNKATLQISLEEDSKLKIEFFDLSGKKVKEIKQDQVFEGKHDIVVNTSKFKEGIYFCRITTDQWIKAKRILVKR